MTRLDSFAMPSLPQVLMDPLSLSPANLGDSEGMPYQPDPLGLNSLNVDDSQQRNPANSAFLPHETDIIDDHLIDVSEDTRLQFG